MANAKCQFEEGDLLVCSYEAFASPVPFQPKTYNGQGDFVLVGKRFMFLGRYNHYNYKLWDMEKARVMYMSTGEWQAFTISSKIS